MLFEPRDFSDMGHFGLGCLQRVESATMYPTPPADTLAQPQAISLLLPQNNLYSIYAVGIPLVSQGNSLCNRATETTGVDRSYTDPSFYYRGKTVVCVM